MPIPFFVGIGAVSAVKAISHQKRKKAKRIVLEAEDRNNKNLEKLKSAHNSAKRSVDSLSKEERKIVSSFEHFSDLFEMLKNRPSFKELKIQGVELPQLKTDDLRSVETDLGSSILSAGVMFIGGAVFSVLSFFGARKAEKKAYEAWDSMLENEDIINTACAFLDDMTTASDNYTASLRAVYKVYKKHLDGLDKLINAEGHCDYHSFTSEEKLMLENTVLLVQLLYSMCKIKLFTVDKNDSSKNKVHYIRANKQINNSRKALEARGLNYSVTQYNVYLEKEEGAYYVDIDVLSGLLPISEEQVRDIEDALDRYSGVMIAESVSRGRADKMIKVIHENSYSVNVYKKKESEVLTTVKPRSNKKNDGYPSYKKLI